jgi:hypothetical protein
MLRVSFYSIVHAEETRNLRAFGDGVTVGGNIIAIT